MTEDFLVSIIMPCFNSGKTIKYSIESVLNQTYSNFELIICDDSSEDDSLDIIHRFEYDIRVKVIKNKYNKGVSGARNSCVDMSSGRFICFLDSDDIWLPDKIKCQLDFMLKENIPFTYGDYFVFSEDFSLNINGKSYPTSKFIAPDELTLNSLFRSCSIGCLTVMIDRVMILGIKFPDSPKEDYALWLTLFDRFSLTAKKYPGILAAYRVSSGSLSGNKIKEISKQFHVLNNYTNLNFWGVLLSMITYVFIGLFKRLFFYKRI